jgi:hypothetical protein
VLSEDSQVKPVSIQVTATILNGGGVTMCALGDKERTHMSVYIRYTDGTVVWQADFSAKQPNAYTAAVMRAARFSMKLGVPIEPIPGDEDV